MSDQLSQQGQSFEFDVLVIGTGLAGLHYCLQLLAIQPKLNIALISKAESIECNSRYAQGGLLPPFHQKIRWSLIYLILYWLEMGYATYLRWNLLSAKGQIL